MLYCMSTGAIGLLFISSAITMSVPFCMGKIIDIIYTSSQDPGQMVETLSYVCKILCGVFLLGGTANFGRVYLIQTSGEKLINFPYLFILFALINNVKALQGMNEWFMNVFVKKSMRLVGNFQTRNI